MCGRYTQSRPVKELESALKDLAVEFDPAPRFNIAPAQHAAVIFPDNLGPVCREACWGLQPDWARDRTAPQINARSETAAQKPTFREAFRNRRCLVPSTGFFEWHRSGKTKTPWFIFPRQDPFMLFAAIWEPSQDNLPGFALLTTGPNSIMEPIHDRMPVILPPSAWETWLNAPEDADLSPLLAPCPSSWLACHTVSDHVNKTTHDDPSCIARADRFVQDDLF